EDVTQMTANLKAPIVINLKEQIAKQVVLQENEYSIKHLMFKELRQHLITIRSQQRSARPESEVHASPVAIRNIPPSLTVKSLQA
ncbi:MAG TPA: flagellar assembly protein FliW, partial [Bdellovibrionota bacterium]|nr:flagellar assembly protein FliW [Bdellovibrionota bacterium]